MSKTISVYKMAYNREVKMYESVVELDQVHRYNMFVKSIKLQKRQRQCHCT